MPRDYVFSDVREETRNVTAYLLHHNLYRETFLKDMAMSEVSSRHIFAYRLY